MKDQIKSQKGQDITDLTEDQARAHIESLMWPDGQPICRQCGSVNAYRMQGTSCRPGLCRCRDCKKQFTVTVGTIFEDTHIPLRKWVRGFHLMSTSKKGISALQLMRNLGLGSYPTAWFMAHRIREAMKREPVAGLLKGTVEVDETYVGGKPRPHANGKRTGLRGRGTSKQPVIVLIERDGTAISHPIQYVTGKSLKGAIREHVDKSATIMTDDCSSYWGIGKEFAGGHHAVKHSQGEYARGNIHSNTAESFFSLIKRGVYGTFHQVSKKHLHRYCDEFAFRWNGRKLSDVQRCQIAVKGSVGKRLMYQTPVKPGPLWP